MFIQNSLINIIEFIFTGVDIFFNSNDYNNMILYRHLNVALFQAFQLEFLKHKNLLRCSHYETFGKY